jgi:pimeloyl-ACP methyl ester carboxylesterase
MAVYAAAMAGLPSDHETADVATSFGTVRTYRFEGSADRTPIVLLHGRSASTPMWRANFASLMAHRTLISVDLLGEPGMSVQDASIGGAVDEARWLDEMLTGLRLDRVHLLGVSIGGWTATSHAVHRPGRAASLTLLDPAMTFARLPVKTVLATLPLVVPGAPEALRRRVLRWIAGGADVDDTLPEVALISAGSTDFVLTKAPPTLFDDEQLRALDVPVLALIAGRSVIHDSAKAAARARRLLPFGQVEVWPDASHAINGEYADEIARRAHRFWDEVDGT